VLVGRNRGRRRPGSNRTVFGTANVTRAGQVIPAARTHGRMRATVPPPQAKLPRRRRRGPAPLASRKSAPPRARWFAFDTASAAPCVRSTVHSGPANAGLPIMRSATLRALPPRRFRDPWIYRTGWNRRDPRKPRPARHDQAPEMHKPVDAPNFRAPRPFEPARRTQVPAAPPFSQAPPVSRFIPKQEPAVSVEWLGLKRATSATHGLPVVVRNTGPVAVHRSSCATRCRWASLTAPASRSPPMITAC